MVFHNKVRDLIGYFDTKTCRVDTDNPRGKVLEKWDRILTDLLL